MGRGARRSLLKTHHVDGMHIEGVKGKKLWHLLSTGTLTQTWRKREDILEVRFYKVNLCNTIRMTMVDMLPTYNG